ncbi:hypothetical protein [Parabacteroides goldsteinii]|uniref:hypothetical protein n=1 Tax=Parabacteroides goldsteinii TaxID=328812 RepID=UPI003AB53BB9
MKTMFLLLVNLLFATGTVLQAQDKMPQAVSYQAVARDAQGKVVAQKAIGIQVEILKGSTTGTVVFSETHSPTSSQTGTVNLLIGQGTRKIGTFSSVDWGADTYYLQLSMDLNGGSNYEKVSTTQMLPVPYALYAAKAGEVENGGGENTVPSSDVPKFIIVSYESQDDTYSMMAGEVTVSVWDDRAEIDLRCTILYLNGKDQHLVLSVEGLPNGKLGDNRNSLTTPMGRLFEIRYYCSPSKEPPYDTAKLVVKDEITNQIVKEYSFRIVPEIDD